MVLQKSWSQYLKTLTSTPCSDPDETTVTPEQSVRKQNIFRLTYFCFKFKCFVY